MELTISYTLIVESQTKLQGFGTIDEVVMEEEIKIDMKDENEKPVEAFQNKSAIAEECQLILTAATPINNSENETHKFVTPSQIKIGFKPVMQSVGEGADG